MASVTLNIPDDVLRQTEAKLKDRGQDLSEFVVDALLSISEHAQQELSPELERELLHGLASETAEANDEFWDTQISRLADGIQSQQKGST
jgi:hypothetical protein